MFKSSGRYGDALNSYDALKLLALALMITDHLGYYFFSDVQVLRALGRGAFPLFLFLVGYSAVWRVRIDLLIWAGFIIGCSVLTSHPVLPVNILVTIIITRAFMAWFAREEITDRRLFGAVLICAVWYVPLLLMDYSTLGIVFAVAGYLQRTRPAAARTQRWLYGVCALYFSMQIASFHFTILPQLVLLIVAAAMTACMRHFHITPLSAGSLPAPLRRALQWAARNTLPIYALHMIAFMIISLHTSPEIYSHFRWK